MLSKLVTIGVALFGVQLIDEQRRALGLVKQREREISATAQLNLNVLNERVELIEQASQAKQDWETTFNAVSDGIVLIDENRRILLANEAFAKAVNKPVTELAGSNVCSLVHGTEEPIPSCPLERAKSLGKAQAAEIQGHLMGGKLMDVSIFPIPDSPGEPRRFVHLIKTTDS